MKRVEIPQSRCLAGVGRDDITPPVGIYHRMWGAAMHDRSTGVHRPLTATVLYLSGRHGEGSGSKGKAMVALDHCLLRSEEMNELLDRVSSAASIPRDAIIAFFSHTHAAGLMDRRRSELPGGDLIGPYLDSLATKLAALVRKARDRQQPASIVYGVGRCDMARNRDYFDAERGEYVCGFNPEGGADDTVLVGRITDEGGKRLAMIVNYACHPTTLAWENTLISPDYIGAMCEVVEHATGAPCLFIQGASGDIGPRDGFVGDVAVADRNGRQLGYAVMSAVESMPGPGTSYEYTGPVISGATLGTWQYIPVSADRRHQAAIGEHHASIIAGVITVSVKQNHDRAAIAHDGIQVAGGAEIIAAVEPDLLVPPDIGSVFCHGANAGGVRVTVLVRNDLQIGSAIDADRVRIPVIPVADRRLRGPEASPRIR